MSAEDTLKQICKELADEGIWPPYTLNIGDGERQSVTLNVTVSFTMKDIRIVDKAPENYLGMAEGLEGAEAIQDCEKLLGHATEIVIHQDTYYVIPK